MNRQVLGTERRLAQVIGAGITAVGLGASPRVYQIWARRIGVELAHLRLVGALTGLIGVLRRLENGTWSGAEGLLDMADALRGLLDRLVTWEHATENLPASVVVAAQGCLTALEPSMVPPNVVASIAPPSGREWLSAPTDTHDSETEELAQLLERLRSQTRAYAIELLDRHGQSVASRAEAEAAPAEGAEGGPDFEVLGRLSPEMIAALPRLEWSHRLMLPEGRSLLVSSVGADALLLAVGGADTAWAGLGDPDTRGALQSLLRRYREQLESLETERIEGYEPADAEEPQE